MTTKQQQQDSDEFIITRFQLKQLQNFASLEFVCQAILSHPHTSSTEAQKLNYDGNSEACLDCKGFHADEGECAPCDTCEFKQKEHATAIRNEMLDRVGRGILKLSGIVEGAHYDPNDCRIPQIGVDSLGDLIRSLHPNGSHCDSCDHWDMCEGCPYTDERAGAKEQT